jgi:uncharacterized phage protein gp47/JayE
MPIENGDYTPTTEEQISQLLEQFATDEDNFGNDIDLTPNSVFSSIFDTVSKTQASLEDDISDVYDSAFLDTATGEELDRVVEITGVQRRDAQRATGHIEFSNQDTVTQEYVIPEGTLVETASSEPTQYRTTESRTLAPIETFEDGDITNYLGDTTSFTTQTSTVFEGSVALESTASGKIFVGDETVRRGDTFTVRQQTVGGGVLFCVQNTDDYYEAVVDGTNLTVNKYSGGTVVDSSTATVSYPSNEWGYYEIELSTKDITVTVYNNSDTQLATVTLVDTDYFGGGHGFVANSSGVFYDLYSFKTVGANIEATERGVEGNSGANTLTVLPSPPNGVDSIANPQRIGDPQLVDLLNRPLVQGQNEETDEQLRSRVRSTLTSSGKATTNALISTLINDIDSVNSVSVFENKTDTAVNGLPPYSFECVVLGGNDQSIAETIFDTKAVTAQDVSGVNGTSVSQQVTAINGQIFTVEFSRPNKVSVSMTLSIVTTNEYVGDDIVKDNIVEYIGGVDTSDTDIVGLGVGEDVYIDEIENIVVGITESGVRGIDDTNTTYTPTPTTDANGLEIIDVVDNEVANVTASDITINVVN